MSAEGKTDIPHVANVVTLLRNLLGEGEVAEFLRHFEDPIFSGVIILLLAGVIYIASRRREMIPGGFQNLMEAMIERVSNFFGEVLGPQGRPYIPFVSTLFLYIFCMNMAGLIPGLKSPTANLNTTVGLALMVFLYVQSIGIRKLGLIGYLDHLAGQPQSVVGWMLVPLMLPLHLVEELAKPMSLSVRLFGNIFGEDTLIAAFVGFGMQALSGLGIPVGLPLQLPFMLLTLLLGTIQALVFSLLSTIYIFTMLPHEEHH